MNRLMIAALLLFLSSCATVKPVAPVVEAAPPEVRCKQQDAPAVPRAPRGNEWIDWTPPGLGETQGAARLSRKAALWIAETMAVVEKLRGLRTVEHTCLDELEKRGLITQ
jgi:hypothetical protein